MGKINRRIRNILAVLGILILITLGLLNSPWVQHKVALRVTHAIEEKVGTKVYLGNLSCRLPADILLDTLRIDDREGETLVSADKLAVKVDWWPLITKRHISIRNIRLYNPAISVRTDSVGAEPNYKFFLDAFHSGAQVSIPPIQVNSIIIRGARLKYDVLSEPETVGQFNPSHIDVNSLNTHLSLKTLTSDSLSVFMRQLSLTEKSGFQLDNLLFRLVANKQGAALVGFNLRMPQSEIRIDSLFADYASNSIRFRSIIPSSSIAVTDLSAFVPSWRNNSSVLSLSSSLKGDLDGRFDVNHLILRLNRRDVDILLQGRGDLRREYAGFLDGNLLRMNVTPSGWNAIEGLLGAIDDLGGTSLQPLCKEWGARLGATSLTGVASLQMSSSGLPETIKADLSLHSDIGEADMKASLKGENYVTALNARSLALGHLIENKDLGNLTATLSAKGRANLEAQKLLSANVDRKSVV